MIQKPEEKDPRRNRRHQMPLIAVILMCIGLLTVLYFLITYVLMPILAMMTVS